MQWELKRLDVVQTGKVLAALYAIVTLIMIPFLVMGIVAGAMESIIVLFMALLYPVLGFVCGLVGAALYNAVAQWVGGFQFTLQPWGPPPSPEGNGN